MRVPREKDSPVDLLHLLWGPLLLNHALLLAGAALLLVGDSRATPSWELTGLGLCVAGVVIEIVVIVWSAGLITARAGSGAIYRGESPHLRPAPKPSAKFCPWCGWTGVPGPSRICLRCYRPTVPPVRLG